MTAIRELFVSLGAQISDEGLEEFEQKVKESKAAMIAADKAVKSYEKSSQALAKTEAALAKVIEQETKAREALTRATEADDAQGQIAAAKALRQATKRSKVLEAQVTKQRKSTEGLRDAQNEQFLAQARLADDVKARDAMKKLQDKTDALSIGANKAAEGFGTLLQAAAALAVGIAAVGAAFVATTLKVAKASEEILRSSDALGTTVEKFQEYKFAFDALGASTDDLMDALGTITDRALDATEGSSTYIKEFKRMGIAIADLKGKKPFELFEMYTKAAAKSKDETAVLATAVRLFGDDLGRRLMPALIGSEENFEMLFDVARKSGVIMSEDMVKANRQLAFRFRMLTASVQGLVNEFAARFAPKLEAIVNRLIMFIQQIRESGTATKLLTFVTKEMGKQFGAVVYTVEDLVRRLGGANGLLKVLKVLLPVVGAVGAAIVGIATVKIGAGLLTMLGGTVAAASVLLIKVIAIGAALLFLVGLAQDFYVWTQGGESLIGKLVQGSEWFGAYMKDALATFQELGKEIDTAMTDLSAMYKDILEAFGTDTPGMLKNILRVLIVITAELVKFLLLPVRAIAAIVSGMRSLSMWIGDFVHEYRDALGGLKKAIIDTFSPKAAIAWFLGLHSATEAVFDAIESRTSGWFASIREEAKSLLFLLNPAASFVDSEWKMLDMIAGRTATSPTATSAGSSSVTSNSTQASFEINVQAPAGTQDPRAFGAAVGDEVNRKFARSSIGSGRRG